MNKLLASLFAVAALSLASSAFALEAAKPSASVAKIETTKAAEPAKVAEAKTTDPVKMASVDSTKKHQYKHGKKMEKATESSTAKPEAK
jgi:hypothetical protein